MNLSASQKRVLLAAAYLWAAVALALWVTEPMRRQPLLPGGFTFWVIVDTFVPLLGIVAALFFPAVAGVRILKERRISWSALHPVLPVALAVTAAVAIDWEGLHFKSRWEAQRDRYEAAAIAVAQTPSVGQTGLFAITQGEAVRLPPGFQDLSLEGVAVRQGATRDAKALVFVAASWWTDNWIGYVYLSQTGERPLGQYYRVERLSDHWWLVRGT